MIAMVLGGLFVFRVWLQYFRVLPPFEVARIFVQVTQPWISMCQTILMGARWKPMTASVLGLLIFTICVTILQWVLRHPLSVEGISAIALLVLISLVRWWAWGLMLCLLLESLMSWVGPSPKSRWISAANAPLLRPLRRVIPLFGQFDLSPLIVFIALNIFSNLFSDWFEHILSVGIV